MLSVLRHCWLGGRKGVRPVKIKQCVVGVEQGADCLHIVHLMLLHPRIPSSLAPFKSRLVLPFWYQFTQVVLEKRPLNRVCVCVVNPAVSNEYLTLVP